MSLLPMSLHYFLPQATALPQVRSFCVIQDTAQNFNQRLALPESYPGILLNLGAPLMWVKENGVEVALPRAFLIGLRGKPLQLRATGFCRIVGLNTFAWGMRLFVDEHADLTTPGIIPLTGPWLSLVETSDRLLERHGEAEAVAAVAQFVSTLRRGEQPYHAGVRAATDLLYAMHGMGSMTDLARASYLSLSQLERQFQYAMGLTPKTLARLIRFDSICSGLLAPAPGRLTDLAYTFGYVDQAHLIHEFKAFAGCTPRQALPQIRQLALDAEFLQFS